MYGWGGIVGRRPSHALGLTDEPRATVGLRGQGQEGGAVEVRIRRKKKNLGSDKISYLSAGKAPAWPQRYVFSQNLARTKKTTQKRYLTRS